MTNKEREEIYNRYIKNIEEESQAIINELEYCKKSSDNSKLIRRGIVEYINNLIKILINLIYTIF